MLQEIERNRPVGIASGPCMVYRCKVRHTLRVKGSLDALACCSAAAAA